jgi:hypothetical protein
MGYYPSNNIAFCFVNVCGWGDAVSGDCVDCYSDYGQCMVDECSEFCTNGWGDACDVCLLNNCDDDFEVCSGVFYGCDDEEACNFEEGANMDAQLCEDPIPNFDCDGNCLVELDACGVCGGSGVDTDGDGVCDAQDSTPYGEAALDFTNITSESVDISYNSDVDLYGFQFSISGVTLTGASGGAAADAGFSTSTGNNTVLGFSFSGTFVPAGNGTLVSLTFEPSVSGGILSMSDLIISGYNGDSVAGSVPADTDVPSSCGTAIECWDGEIVCDVADCNDEPIYEDVDYATEIQPILYGSKLYNWHSK